MEQENNHCKLADSIIRETFHFLEQEGFTVISKEIDDDIFKESFVVSFMNEKVKREIRINFQMNDYGKDILYGFNAFVIRLPYDTVNDFFSLSIYLSSIGKAFDQNMINHFDKEEAKVIVQKIAISLKTYLWDVVKGENWLKGYYPQW